MKATVFEKIIIDEDFDCLNNLIRWNDSKRNKNETVAHHTFLVIWFTRILVENLFDSEAHQIKLEITTLALFHDFDEAFTGDILHPFKYNDFNGEEIRHLIKEYCEYRVNTKYRGNNQTDTLFRDHIIAGHYPKFYHTIVKVADWLSMVFYVRKEITLGNHDMKKNYLFCVQKMKAGVEACLRELNKINDDRHRDDWVEVDTTILWDAKKSKFAL